MSPIARVGSAAGYTTIDGTARDELEIKKSRFIAALGRVESEDEARQFIAALRSEFPDARHHCSAFLIGPGRSVQRSNDDGEPSGTAGSPMLDALTRRRTGLDRTDLSDVCAVVVRYFGGTLLGAGGLVRAYSQSVSRALDEASFIDRQPVRFVNIDLDHVAAPRVHSELMSGGISVIGTEYGSDGARLRVALPDDETRLSALERQVSALTGGSAFLDRGESGWLDAAV